MYKEITINENYRDDRALCDFVEALPDRFAGGTLIFEKRNTIRRFAVDSASVPEVIVKRFHRLKGIKRLIYTFFRTTKASRAYHNGLELLARGIDTPEPLAFIEIKSGRLVRDCYFISRPTDFKAIRGPLNDATEFDRPLARAFAVFAARLHEAGVLHHDLNSTNTIYRAEPDGSYSFSVIDTNRMDFTDGRPPLDACIANIVRFTRRLDLFEYVARSYAEVCGLDPDTFAADALTAKHRFDNARRRRKRLLHPTRKY